MQNKKLSQLNETSDALGSDYLLVLNNGQDKKITTANLLKIVTQ